MYKDKIEQHIIEKTIKRCEKSPGLCLEIIPAIYTSPLCGVFFLNSVATARYGALIRTKSPTSCDEHLAESLFQTCSRICQKTFLRSAHTTLQYIFPKFGCHSSLRRIHPGQSPTNCDIHLVKKFKYALEI